MVYSSLRPPARLLVKRIRPSRPGNAASAVGTTDSARARPSAPMIRATRGLETVVIQLLLSLIVRSRPARTGPPAGATPSLHDPATETTVLYPESCASTATYSLQAP